MIDLTDFKNVYKNRACLVCGTGPSMEGFKFREELLTIGVNEIAKWIHPNFLLTVDSMEYTGEHAEKARRIKDTKARVVFAYSIESDYPNSTVINYDFEGLSNCKPGDILSRDHLWACMTSVELAIGLAFYMGFSLIGVIGWDLIGHPCEVHIDKINEDMIKVVKYSMENNITFVNISDESIVSTVPWMNQDEFWNRVQMINDMGGFGEK